MNKRGREQEQEDTHCEQIKRQCALRTENRHALQDHLDKLEIEYKKDKSERNETYINSLLDAMQVLNPGACRRCGLMNGHSENSDLAVVCKEGDIFTNLDYTPSEQAEVAVLANPYNWRERFAFISECVQAANAFSEYYTRLFVNKEPDPTDELKERLTKNALHTMELARKLMEAVGSSEEDKKTFAKISADAQAALARINSPPSSLLL
jgi:hypothetical protein